MYLPAPSSPSPRHVLASNLRALHALEAARQTLTGAGIPMLYLKGAAFLDTLYPDLGARQMGDIDFLIAKRHRRQTRDLLVSLGYELRKPPDGRRHSWQHHYNWQFTLPAADNMVFEVHTELCQPGRYPIAYDDIWSRAVTYRAGGRQIPTLSPEDSLLYLAIHDAKHWFDVDPSRRQDLCRIIEVWRPSWREVIERARQWHLGTAFFVTASAARQAGASVPAWAIEAVGPSRLRRSILDLLIDRSSGRVRWPAHRRLVQLATVVATADRPGDLAGFLSLYAQKRFRDLIGRARPGQVETS